MIPIRPILAILLTCCLLGGTYAYIQIAASLREKPVEFRPDFTEDVYEIQVSRTFDCEGDELAELPAFQVSFKGEEIFTAKESLKREEIVRFEIPKVEVGENELAVTANRPFGEIDLGVISVELFRNDIPVSVQLVASEPDLETITGRVLIDVDKEDAHE